MLAHVRAIKALLAPLGYDVYFGDAVKRGTGGMVVPLTYPYLLLWTSAGLPGVEQAVDDVRLDIDGQVGVTAVATTADGVLIVQNRVRGVLAPGGRAVALTVPGRAAWLRLLDSRPVDIDRAITAHPAFSVDVYRLISTPA